MVDLPKPEHIVSEAMKKPPEYGAGHKLNIHESQIHTMTERYGAKWVERNCNVIKAVMHVYCTKCGKLLQQNAEHACDTTLSPESR